MVEEAVSDVLWFDGMEPMETEGRVQYVEPI